MSRIITLDNWDGEAPTCFANYYYQSAMNGNVDALYDVYNEHFSLDERFAEYLKENGEWWLDTDFAGKHSEPEVA